MTPRPTVFLIDDDEATRRSLPELLGSAEVSVEVHATADSFLAGLGADRPGCAVMELRTATQRLPLPVPIPVIVVGRRLAVPTVVRAMRAGAFDVLEKPCDPRRLLCSVEAALGADARKRLERAGIASLERRLLTLTSREKQIFDHVASGRATKEIAFDLALSPRTVEKHRERIMRKLALQSTGELILAGVQLRTHAASGADSEVFGR